jgi:hypothetical protein
VCAVHEAVHARIVHANDGKRQTTAVGMRAMHVEAHKTAMRAMHEAVHKPIVHADAYARAVQEAVRAWYRIARS